MERRKKKTALENLTVKEVSLVTAGDNKDAKIGLTKRSDVLDEYLKSSFDELLEESKIKREAARVMDVMFDNSYVLRRAFESIISDDKKYPNKIASMKESIQQFCDEYARELDAIDMSKMSLEEVGDSATDWITKKVLHIDNLSEGVKKMTPEELTKQVIAKLEEDGVVKKGGDGGADMIAAITKAVVDATKSQAEEMETLRKVADLSDDQKTYYKALSDDKKPEFLSKTAKERFKIVTEKLVEDEVLKIGTHEIKKSVVGESQFEVFKFQHEQIEKTKKELQIEKDKSELLDFSKRADSQYPHIPGTSELKGKILKAVEKLEDQEVSKAILGTFTSLEKLMSGYLFTENGTPDDINKINTIDDPEAELDKRAEEFSKKDGKISKEQAFVKLVNSDPECKQLYIAARRKTA